MDSQTAAKIIEELAAIILSFAPEAGFIDKYGGTVVERIAGCPETQFCGYFSYKAHVSLEFTKGIRLEDPEGVLEGAGKQRRHIKLRTLDDIAMKRCRSFLIQAAGL